MIAFIYGVLGAMLVLAVFSAGAYTGARLIRPSDRQRSPDEGLSAEETEMQRREREDIKAVNSSFSTMMRYNADMAYGLNDPTERMGRG